MSVYSGGMAICKVCGRDMMGDPGGCVQTVVFPDGVECAPLLWDGDGQCHDCGVDPGGAHHPGCDMERCPRCEGGESQLISCGCLDVAD